MLRLVVPLTLATVDVLVLAGSTGLAILLRSGFLGGSFGFAEFSPVRDYLSLWPAVLMLLAARMSFSLYPGYGLNPSEELRRLTVSSALVIALFTIGGTLFRFGQDYSRLVLALSGLTMLVLLPLTRALTKRLLSTLPFYGEHTWIMGSSTKSQEIADVIRRQPNLGLRVVGMGLEPPDNCSRIKHCIVVPNEVEGPLPKLLDSLNRRFRRVWLVPNLLDVASVWVSPRDLDGHLALELRNNLLEPANAVIKRVCEVLILLLALPIVIPLLLLIALAILIEDRGPVFFRQQRVGRDGVPFAMLKFRTMLTDADAVLQKHLGTDPEAQLEWQRTQKLRNDPRMTRVGRILRRYSLDELPQFWNVFCGEMSIVGPRAITQPELCHYGERAELYTAVLPGLTGLWQVSGRSCLSYEDRVRLDTYYVRNWSIWLDLSILAKTPLTIVAARGAY